MKTAHDIAFMIIVENAFYTVGSRRNRKTMRGKMYQLSIDMILRGLY